MDPDANRGGLPRPRLSSWEVAAALGVLILATALRFWRLTWGLDNTQGWFVEELLFTGPASRWVPFSWQSLDAKSLLYPPLYSYLAGATTALAHLVGLQPKPDAFSLDTFLTTRIPSALAGLATVWLTGRLAARLHADTGANAVRVGIVAAALLAVAPFHVMESHRAGADILLTFGVALTMAACWSLIVRRSPERALLAGMAAGFTFAAKQTGLSMVAPVAWACAEAAYQQRSLRTFAGFAGLALVGFLAAWAICCPPCLVHFGMFWSEIATHRQKMSMAQGVMNHLVPSLGWLGHPFVYELGASLPYALGWPLYALTLAGSAVAIKRHDRADRLVLSTIAPYFLIIGSASVTFPRYLLPLFPGLVIFAARLIGPMQEGRRLLRASVLVAVLAYSLALTVTQVERFSSAQRREVARYTVDTVRAARSPLLSRAPIRVAVPALVPGGMDYFTVSAVLAGAGAKPIAVGAGQWFDADYDAFLLPHWMSIWIRRDAMSADLTRDLSRLESGEAGYVRAKRFPSGYLQSGFYTRLDPGFYGDLWQGDIGYDVYVHRTTRSAREASDTAPASPPTPNAPSLAVPGAGR